MTKDFCPGTSGKSTMCRQCDDLGAVSTKNSRYKYYKYENYDIAIAMSSSRADSVLGHCPGWGYLNI